MTEYVYVVSSKSKIHAVFRDALEAQQHMTSLHEKAGQINGVWKKFYYVDKVPIH